MTEKKLIKRKVDTGYVDGEAVVNCVCGNKFWVFGYRICDCGRKYTVEATLFVEEEVATNPLTEPE